jgi:hypothetical protein
VSEPTPTPEQEQRRRSFRISRDLVLFCVGLLIVVHETLFTEIDRPSLLIVGAALLGLPFYLRANGK